MDRTIAKSSPLAAVDRAAARPAPVGHGRGQRRGHGHGRQRGPAARLGALALLGCLVGAAPGCVERVLIVRSDPPDAAIYVDGALIGQMGPGGEPVAMPFDFYGTRTIEARRPGYVPIRRDVALEPPWYQYFPIDLVADLLWPGTLRDEHEVTLVLERRGPPRDAEALEREAEHFGRTQADRP